MTHVLFFVGAQRYAGAEESLRSLVAALPVDVSVTIAGPHRPVLELIAGPRPTTNIALLPDVSSKQHLGRLPRLWRELGRIDATVVHLNKTEVADLRYVEAVLALGPTPVVSVVHHVERPTTAVARRLAAMLAHRARAVVAVSQSTATELETILDLPAGSTTVIPNALPASGNISTTRPPEEPATVGVLARFVPHKGVEHVIEAIARLPAVRLLIGGEGPGRNDLEQLVDQFDLASRVTFLGWVDPGEVFDHSHIIVSAAFIEGHPMTLLDAQRRGLPVVAADAGGVADIVDHGVTGLVVAPGDPDALCRAIDRLVGDPVLRAAMGRAAIERSARVNDHSAMAAAYLDLYQSTPAAPAAARLVG